MEESYPVGVERDIQEGEKVSLRSTPTVFVDGKLAPAANKKLLEMIIEQIIRDKATSAAVPGLMPEQ